MSIETNSEDKVWVTLSRTINLGNYENIKIDAGISQTITDLHDDLAFKLMESLSDQVFDILLEKGKEYKRILKPKKIKKHVVDTDTD